MTTKSTRLVDQAIYILLESLTYILEGHSGVISFEKKRKVRLGSITTSSFHAGASSENPGVVVWMSHLHDSASKTVPYLLTVLDLVRRILAIDPTKRPSAINTTLTLQYAYLMITYQQLSGSFRRGLMSHDNYEFRAEYERFRIWGELSTLASVDKDDPRSSRSLDPDFAFEKAVKLLREMQESVEGILEIGANDLYTYQHPIAEITDSFCIILSLPIQRQL